MIDSTKILNTLNFCRMELQRERNKDKNVNYDKIVLLQRIINQLQ